MTSPLSGVQSLPFGKDAGRQCTLEEFKTKIIIETVEKIKPIKYYNNFKEEKLQIKKDQNTKTGVYCLLNLINGHFYIGSSVNIAIRMSNYLNNAFLKQNKNNKMPIVQALLKYGQDNFALLIIEYVPCKNASGLVIRETYYIKQFFPYYNVLKQGYSS